MTTKIEWVKDASGNQGVTWNPITGCTKVSPGCAHCYAEKMAKRLKAMGRPEYQDAVNGDGRWTGKITLVPERLDQPLRWRKPRMVFVNSMSDLFHEEVPDDFIIKVFARMTAFTEHTYQVLTKRPERMRDFVIQNAYGLANWPNIWLGTTVENQQTADERIPWLLQTPAAVRFLSCEPLLGPIDLELVNADVSPIDFARLHGLHWIIVGGESGSNARPMHPDWVRTLRDQAMVAGVPFFFKQWGAWQPVGDLHHWSITDDISNKENQWIVVCGEWQGWAKRRPVAC
jgi:protein gp37